MEYLVLGIFGIPAVIAASLLFGKTILNICLESAEG